MALTLSTKVKSTWFDSQVTPQERLDAFKQLNRKSQDMLRMVGYVPGQVPLDSQFDRLLEAALEDASREAVRACSRAFSTRNLSTLNDLLASLMKLDRLGVEPNENVYSLAQRVIYLVVEDLERKAYLAFREFPSSQNYNACYASSRRLEVLGLEPSQDYPVNPWPKVQLVSRYQPGPRTHVVVPGDTLSKISKQYWGHEYLWDAIYMSNPYQGHPDRIFPGTKMVIQG